MQQFETIVALITPRVQHGVVTTDENASPKAVIIPHQDLYAVCHELYHNPATYFDMLSCVTGLDNGAEAGTMEVIYNLYSIPHDLHLMVKVVLPRTEPVVDSLCALWKTADWFEREVFDMYGISFLNHPDLRRILLPADWQGYPLRKDYQQQDYYRNIKVEY